MDLGHELVQGPYQQIAYLVKAPVQEERTLACGRVWFVIYVIYYLYLLLLLANKRVRLGRAKMGRSQEGWAA